MHLDPWHLRLQMEKLKIKNQRVPLFCAQFFLINNHGTESNHIKPIKPHCFCLTSFVLLQSFSEKSADTIPPGLFGGERHMEVSNRCHYYPDIHHLTGTTLVIASASHKPITTSGYFMKLPWPLHPLVGCSHLSSFSMCRLLSLHPRHHWGRTLCSSHRGRHTFVRSEIWRTSVSVVSWPLASWSLAASQHVAAYETCHPANKSKRLIYCTSMHINVHHTPTYSWFFFTVPTTLNSLEGAAHLQSLERSLAQSFGQTPSSQPPSGDVELGWPHIFSIKYRCVFGAKNQFLENSFKKNSSSP